MTDTTRTYLARREYPSATRTGEARAAVVVRTAAGVERPLPPAPTFDGQYDWLRLGMPSLNLAAALLTDLLGYLPHMRLVELFLMQTVHTWVGDAWTRTSGELLRDVQRHRDHLGNPTCLRCLDARTVSVGGEPTACACATRRVAV